jgi:nucleotide-binding universal stress UspA family protein
MMTDSGPVVLCYDGSDASAHAIRVAARLLGGRREAVVATVYTVHLADLMPVVDVMDRARRLAEDGARIAGEAGFDADHVGIDAVSIWKGLVDHAEQTMADVVVAGTTGTSALGTVLGSVAYNIAHHCRRPVLLVRKEH